MSEPSENLSSAQLRKAKIREKYKGINPDELDVIPALPQYKLNDENRPQRVAVYARVSTDDPNQTSSYELQKNHYQDVVNAHVGWSLVKIYADEGISGTSLQHRESFIEMINDCNAGMIDLILTKSVSRFARNVVDCIMHVRKLAALNPPVAVFFETENIYTLDSNSEMSLSFISTLAQEESHTKSEIMNSSIEMRFKRGIFLTPPLLGYDQDENGNLIVNEEEAKTVRLAFFMYLFGYSTQQIADTFNELNRETKKGNTKWTSNSILAILQNERHCGDVLARKTFTPSYLDHKSKKNKQDRNQYRKKDHHEAIISRDDFIAVQHLISNSKYGNKGTIPELIVIPDGLLKGFVIVHPTWANYKVQHYIEASQSVYEDDYTDKDILIKANSGDFDLRGYEIARGQFFNTAKRISMTVYPKHIVCSSECIHKLSSEYVELLIHPQKMLIAIRPSNKNAKGSFKWYRKVNGSILRRNIAGAAFLPSIYQVFNWDNELKYRLAGIKKQFGDEEVLIFNAYEPEILIPTSIIDENEDGPLLDLDEESTPLGTKSSYLAYPKEWSESFGNDYYSNSHMLESDDSQSWNVQSEGTVFPTEESELNVTKPSELEEKIKSIKDDIKEKKK